MKKIILILMVCVVGGCQQPDVDLHSEAAKIEQLTKEWLAAESAKDIEGSLSFIAKDGLYLPADWPSLQGHEEIGNYLKTTFDYEMGEISGGTEHIEVAKSGDFAYEFGRTEVPFTFASGDTIIKAHYLVVWKKIDGEWKAVATSVSASR